MILGHSLNSGGTQLLHAPSIISGGGGLGAKSKLSIKKSILDKKSDSTS